GLLFTWADPFAATGPAAPRPHRIEAHGDVLAIRFGDAAEHAPTALRGSLAIAALATDGVELTARSRFDPVADRELWADFAADGRLEASARGPPPATGAPRWRLCAP